MRNCGFVGVGVVGLLLCGTASSAQDLGRYREFELGSDVAVVSTVTGTAASDLKVIHHRPAVIQELTWRPRYGARRAASPDTESVEQVVFGFHDGRLFRVTVDYDREQTKGLIDADMVEAISAVYGPQVKPSVSRRRQAPSVYDDPHSYRAVGQRGQLSHVVPIVLVRDQFQADRDGRTDCCVGAHGSRTSPRTGCSRGAPARGGPREKRSGRSPCGRGESPIDEQSDLSALMPNDLWLVVPSHVVR